MIARAGARPNEGTTLEEALPLSFCKNSKKLIEIRHSGAVQLLQYLGPPLQILVDNPTLALRDTALGADLGLQQVAVHVARELVLIRGRVPVEDLGEGEGLRRGVVAE